MYVELTEKRKGFRKQCIRCQGDGWIIIEVIDDNEAIDQIQVQCEDCNGQGYYE